ncbi:MAG: cation:proton antiporter [Gemmatimonadetes bacterium]|nr:cation:proton antiporter [Gemmatimonadota bacterium]
MHDAYDFLANLALVLCVAALTTLIFQRLRQPVVFGYLLAGLIIGPHIPIPLVADDATVHTLAELGVILLMFGLGIEFSLRKLLRVGPAAGLVAVAQSTAMVSIGYGVGQLFGWTPLESFYAGAVIAISSTTIIVKAFAEQGARGKFTEIVFGILIIEDMIAIFLLAILTTVSAGQAVSAAGLAVTAARLATFLAALIGVGLLVVPRLVRFVVRVNRPETTVITAVGVCFACALLALQFGYSVALGAFIAGTLVAESGVQEAVETLVRPVRDIFAAIFFVAVGMLIDPALIAGHWTAVAALTGAVVAGKVLAVTVSAFLTGFPLRTSVQSGMSLAQIGEFSFIIAGMGLSTGATRPFLYPVAIAVSAVTTLTTPWLIRASGPVASYVDRKLPRPLQTFVALYGSWLERLRSAPGEAGRRSWLRRRVGLLLLDAVLLAFLVIGVSLELTRVTALLTAATGISPQAARAVITAAATVVAAPLLLGLVRGSRGLAVELAERAIPPAPPGRPDFGLAPRRVLAVTLQLAVVMLLGVLLVAVTQPFVPPFRGAVVLAAVAALLAVALWRGAATLQGHARAGAEVIAAALARQMASDEGEATTGARATPPALPAPGMAPLQWVRETLPGLGHPEPIRIEAGSPAVDRTLAELNLRGLTGATVLAITRDGEEIIVPTGRERLRAGDVLAVAGSQESIEAATRLLRPDAAGPEAEDRTS